MKLKTIALIDTRSEVPGVSLGILVSTHPDMMAAFAANEAFQKNERSSHPNEDRHVKRPTPGRKRGAASAPCRKQMNQFDEPDWRNGFVALGGRAQNSTKWHEGECLRSPSNSFG
jgi:hypothetical protein